MALNTIADLSTTAGSNVDVLGQNASGSGSANTIDTLFQNLMALIARAYGDIGGLGTVGGSANAITLTSKSTYQALENGLVLSFKAASANTGAATLNLDGLGAKAIRRQGDSALSANDIVANGRYLIQYDEAYNSAAGAWVLMNRAPQVVSSTDNTLPRFDGTGGNLQTSSMVVDDSGNITSFGGQVAFPASQSASSDANTLDDYEEGTFTPTVIGTTTAGSGTYTTQAGHYVKIGARVFFDLELVWTAHTGTGNMKVSGLPFTNGNRKAPCSVSYSSLTFSGSHVVAYVEASATTTFIGTAQSTAAETATAIDTAATFRISGSYSVV